jgi:transposase
LLLAKLRRMQFGRSSEALGERIEQLELSIEELEATDAQAAPASALPRTPKSKPARRPLPMSLPREVHVHAPLPPKSPMPDTSTQPLATFLSRARVFVQRCSCTTTLRA